MASTGSSRFATVTAEKKKQIIDDKNAKNTLKAGRLWMNVLRTYCREKKISFDPKVICPVDLDVILQSFYLEVRKEDGGYYKKTSFTALRHGIQREFHRIRGIDDHIDILEGPQYTKSSELFHAQSVQLKKMGLARVEHTPEISVADIKLLYAEGGVFSTDSPVQLQFKVFFEVVLFFCRREEGLRDLKAFGI